MPTRWTLPVASGAKPPTPTGLARARTVSEPDRATSVSRSCGTEIQQLPADTRIEWGWPRKFLTLTTDELSERAGLRWERHADDLGEALVSVVVTGPRKPILALQYYEGAPQPGVFVIADESVSDTAIRQSLAALGVGASEISDAVSPPDEQSTQVAALKKELEAASTRLDAVEKVAAAARAAANRATAAIREVARSTGARKTTARSSRAASSPRSGARKTTSRSTRRAKS
jgi:hypothetical protein